MIAWCVQGIFCVILGLVIGTVDQFKPTETSIFFGIDPLTESTENYTSNNKFYDLLK